MKTSIDNVNGYDVQIYTDKNHRNIIECSASFGKTTRGSGYSTFEYGFFTDPHISLAKGEPGARATEKNLKARLKNKPK